ncbi:hypothetical protein AVEN_176182-1 [Araneus ventricosus]|uniref:Uncharacterized protein n=1 Tax=Araneus ventricosus TaxID=182803 RepID=A0A4Y2Q7T1_ARAVE|nr:hypothetical protein AVEN_176182-1 [Araneus ventricosus]
MRPDRSDKHSPQTGADEEPERFVCGGAPRQQEHVRPQVHHGRSDEDRDPPQPLHQPPRREGGDAAYGSVAHGHQAHVVRAPRTADEGLEKWKANAFLNKN